MNDLDKVKDHEKSVGYIVATTTTMKSGKEGDGSKLPSFKVIKLEVINDHFTVHV